MATPNEERSERAYRTLLIYPGRDPEDVEASAVDLIADLLHMVKDYGDPADVHRIALDHYQAELAEELVERLGGERVTD